MIQINISALPWQEFSVVLDGQNCVISLRQVAESMYCNLTCNGVDIFKGRKICNGTPINTYPSPNFKGRLMIDTLGNSDPQYEGLNERWILVYANDGEVLNG
ncbi:hypothetical protein [uncultured Parasutterella sp.]|uniref:phage baseplate plug family protein n=1 Tax=uncultured Parasutterella sp. TaxID=1263098 RepID=UPI0025B69335|nr:hypothetical protein [uncultured Parasutterella sp.]